MVPERMNPYSDVSLDNAPEQSNVSPANAPSRTAPANPYEDTANQFEQKRDLLLNRAVKRAMGNPPDEVASILGLSRNTGLSPELVRNNREDVEYRVRQREIGAQVASLSQPGQEWLTEKYNLDISQDDLANIKAMDDAVNNKAWYEQDFLDKLMGSVKTGWLNVRQATSSVEATPAINRISEFDRIDELLADGDREAALAYVRENDRALAGTALKADLLRYIGAEPEDRAELRAMSSEQLQTAAGEIAGQEAERSAIPMDPNLAQASEEGTFSGVLGAIAEDPGIIPRVTTESLLTSIPTLAAGVLGTMAGGGPVAPLSAAAASFGTERGLGLISALRDAGVDTSDPDQIIAAMTDPSILEDAQRRAEYKALGVSALDLVGAGLAQRTLAPRSIGGKTLSARQREAINLFSQMPVQGVQEGAGEAAGQYLADGEVNRAEIALEAIGGAFGSTSDVLAFSGNRVFESVVNNANSYRRAKKDRAYLTAVKDAANQTQLRKRDPQALKELLDRLSQTGPVNEIYISGKDFQELFQSKDLDPEEYAQKMESVGEQYYESLVTGGDIAVSVSDFATVIAPTEAAEDFIARARTKTDGMSPSEADQWMNEQARPTLEAIINYDGDQAGQSAQKVFDDVVGQLLATGMDQQTAERNASLYRAFFDVMGQTEDVDPFDLYQQYNLAITREMPDILKRRDNNVDALDPLLDRLRSGDVPSQQSIFGNSLTDFLREQGGVQDYAGELSAMDADKSREAFQRKLVSEQGLDLATAAERAAEAGYIDSRDTNQLLAALDRELRGEPVYPKGGEDTKLQETAADLMALQEELDRLGVDLAEVDNATAKEALQSVVYGDAQQGAEVELDQVATQTEAFRNWFGDSKVVDENGEPLVVYHASQEPITSFDRSRIGEKHGQAGDYGGGFYFSADPQYTDRFGEVKTPVYLSMQNPFVIYDGQNNNDGPNGQIYRQFKRIMRSQDPEAASEFLRQEGFDGVIVHGAGGSIGSGDFLEVVAFRPEQIKSATANRGNYDPNDTSILNQSAQPVSDIEAQLKSEFPGLKLNLRESLSAVVVDRIEVPESQRQAGTGSKVMQKITDWADASGKTLALTPTGDFGGNKTRLTSFYKRFGFVPNRGKNKDFAVSESMIRPAEMNQDIGGKRGVIRIDRTNRNFNIELLAKADLSTFLHESGHFFLEVLGDLSQQEGASDRVKSQYQTILDWFEVDSREQIGVEQHEQFARGFEAYLMEGKAPTPELQSVFARFRAWLLAVYKRLTALNVELTDEVRNVMDRILATDEEIERARGEAGMTDSLSDIAAMGWTDKERSDYRDLIDEAKEAAKSELIARQMKDLRKTEKDWYKQERAKVREEVLKEMNQNRVYRALAHLQNGKLPDGSDLPDGVQPVKLNKQELLDDYGKEFLKRLPNPKNELVGGPYVYTREGGVPAQSVAELYGFSSGDELVQALANARPMKELIEAETDARMRNLYPDINVSGEAAEAAIAAVHNDKAAERMLMELKKLHSKSRFSGKPMAPAKLLRETAERLVRGQAIKNIRPDLYRRAESRAANDAFTEATNNDFDSAFESKQRQLLNHYMYREAVKAREEAEQVYNYVKTFNKKTTRQTIGKAGSDYLERIDEIIDQFEFRRVSIRQLGRRESLRSWMEKQNNDNAPVDIPDYVLDQAQRVNYRDISVEELAAVKDAIANLEHVARLKTRLIKDAKGREVKQAREEIAATIRDNANRKVKSAIESHLPSENRKYMLADYLASHRRLSSLIREMDGQRDGGTVWELIMKPINEAGDQEANMILESNEKLHELFKQYSPLELRRFMKKQYVPAINDSLTKQGAIMVALNTGTEDNLQKLKDGYGWSDSQVQAILSTLEKKDWDFIQGVWDHINSYWPLIEAKEKRVKGVAPEKVEARQVLTEHGPYRGGYFPLKYDERQEADAYADRIKDMADMAMKGAFSSSTTRRGHTKERVKGVERKVKLDFGVVFQHLTEVVHDLTHHEMLIDVSRLMKGSDVKDAIVESFGMPAYTTIDNAITDIAAGDVPAVRAHERALQHLRNGVTIAGMGWNIGTALLQPLGITNSIVRIGPKWVGQGIKRWMSSAKNMEGITAWITEVSPFMKNRFTTQNREINDVRNKMKGQGRLSWIEDSYFWMITTMQKVVDIPTWLGAYEKALSEGATETDAYRMADQAVIDAQGGGQIKDLAQIQRGHPALKLFTNFISYFVTTWNLMAESGRRTNFKHPAEVGRFASDFLLLYTIPAILGWMVKGAVRGFDDDDLEDPMKALAAEQISFLAGGFFGLREFTSAISGFYGYSGPAGTRFFSEGSSIITQAQQGEVDRALLKSMNDTAGILFHYPSGQVQRTTEGFISILEGETQNPGALLLGPPKD